MLYVKNAFLSYFSTSSQLQLRHFYLGISFCMLMWKKSVTCELSHILIPSINSGIPTCSSGRSTSCSHSKKDQGSRDSDQRTPNWYAPAGLKCTELYTVAHCQERAPHPMPPIPCLALNDPICNTKCGRTHSLLWQQYTNTISWYLYWYCGLQHGYVKTSYGVLKIETNI